MLSHQVRLRLAALASTGVLSLATTTFVYGATGSVVAGTGADAVSHVPVALMSSVTDTATNAAVDAAVNTGAYGALFSALPTWPTPTVGVDIPGVFSAWDNLFGWVLWNYGLGFSIGNDGPLGIQQWMPSNPFFDVVAESYGTTQGTWPGVASLVGLLTPLGGFTNTESYANFFDPTGTTCLICDTFNLLAPGGTSLFSWTSDIPLPTQGLPEFGLSILGTPIFGGNLGDAFDVSALANGFPALVNDPPAALSSLATDPTSYFSDYLNGLVTFLGGPTAADADLALLLGSLAGNSGDYVALLGNISADLSANLSSTIGSELASVLPNLLVNLIP
jgi:hypothetical protein